MSRFRWISWGNPGGRSGRTSAPAARTPELVETLTGLKGISPVETALGAKSRSLDPTANSGLSRGATELSTIVTKLYGYEHQIDK